MGTRAFGFAVFSAALLTSTSVFAQLSVDLGGRFDATASTGETFVDGGASNSGQTTVAGASAALAADGKSNSNVVGGAAGRVDLTVSQSSHFYDYGAFIRLDVDAKNKVVADVDGHIFVDTGLGKFQFGTDIDAFQTAFDTDGLSVGPITPIKSVALPLDQHKFDHEVDAEVSLVWTSPAYGPFVAAAEVDEDGHLGGSISYKGNAGLLGLDASLGWASGDAVGGSAEATYNEWKFGVFGGQDDDSERYYGGGIGYDLGELDLSLDGAVAKASWELAGDQVDAEDYSIAAGASYALAPGLSLAGSLGYFDHEASSTVSGVATTLQDEDLVRGEGRLRIEF